MLVATHSGPFHADDVLAWALVRTFVDPQAELLRTRDEAALDDADVVFDVGRVFDPATCRFDHHQASYTGPRSSAGMVLDWLESEGKVREPVAGFLRHRLVDYVDAVDNGRREPDQDVPCYPLMVEALSQGHDSPEAYDDAFVRAGEVARGMVEGLVRGFEAAEQAAVTVRTEMDRARAEGRNVLVFETYLKWKPTYFASGGEDHPTEFVLFPGVQKDFKLVAIPPRAHAFGQKRSLPAAWAGLSGEELALVSGEPSAVFCHKNLFIAGFSSREGAERAMKRYGLWFRPDHPQN